jgi:hypothetical protein
VPDERCGSSSTTSLTTLPTFRQHHLKRRQRYEK